MVSDVVLSFFTSSTLPLFGIRVLEVSIFVGRGRGAKPRLLEVEKESVSSIVRPFDEKLLIACQTFPFGMLSIPREFDDERVELEPSLPLSLSTTATLDCVAEPTCIPWS